MEIVVDISSAAEATTRAGLAMRMPGSSSQGRCSWISGASRLPGWRRKSLPI